jgi:hypothetical protein
MNSNMKHMQAAKEIVFGNILSCLCQIYDKQERPLPRTIPINLLGVEWKDNIPLKNPTS